MKTKLFFRNLIMLFVVVFVTCDIQAAKYIWDMNTIQTTTQHICSSFPVSADTIVIYKPSGWPVNVTDWQIFDASYTIVSDVDAQDSVVFLPTTAQTFYITAYYNGITKYMWLNVHSAPPSHADFYVVSGGQINAAQDTVFMCSGSVTVATNADGNEATSWYWGSTTGFYSVDAPVIITLPGKYFLERADPCGVTIDTFEVVMLPTVLPVWQDTSFCNTPVSLTLDPGPGWSYEWSTSATTQTITVTTEGYYSVDLSNLCTSGTVGIQVDQETFLLPDLALYSQIPAPILCQSEVAILDPNSGYTYDTYQWRKDGVTPVGNQPTLTVDYALGSGYYSIEVTQGACSASSDINVIFYADPQAPTHCVSSFDPLTGTNMTVFEAINEPDVTEYVLMYKQGSTWIPVDTVAETGLSSYTLYDEINDPNQQSQTYSVFARHTCSNFSPLGDWHKTIRTTIVQIISGDYILMILDDYATLSGYTPDSYTIWIDSLNDGNFTQIGILNGGNHSFTIDSPVNGAAYYASVNLPWNCGGAKSFPTAFSNRKVFTITGIADQNSPISVSIYPNPASDGIFHVEASDLLEIVVTDQLGRVLASFKNTSIINLSGFAQGVYYARVSTSRGSTVVQLMVK